MPEYEVFLDRTITLAARIKVEAPDEEQVKEVIQTMHKDGKFGTVQWTIVQAQVEPLPDWPWREGLDEIEVYDITDLDLEEKIEVELRALEEDA